MKPIGNLRAILDNRVQGVGIDTVDIDGRGGTPMTATKRCPTCGQPLPPRFARRRLRAVAPEARVAVSRESGLENFLPVAGRDNFNQVAEEPEVIPSLFVSADALGSI